MSNSLTHGEEKEFMKKKADLAKMAIEAYQPVLEKIEAKGETPELVAMMKNMINMSKELLIMYRRTQKLENEIDRLQNKVDFYEEYMGVI